ncbi:MAG: DUF1440 domain-containing protein [Chloroflexi bacterium]|nr:DUF1440 domain-containing protein [Chloroflexota bacterium]
MSPTGVLWAGLAGFIATAPMTATMIALHRRLPWDERYPLPPRFVTMATADKLEADDDMSESDRAVATLGAHFAYGAAAGMVYPAVAKLLPLGPALSGATLGIMVWTVSYLGWLPLTGLHRSATEEPGNRNALMLVAHLVWGSVTGVIAERLSRRE